MYPPRRLEVLRRGPRLTGWCAALATIGAMLALAPGCREPASPVGGGEDAAGGTAEQPRPDDGQVLPDADPGANTTTPDPRGGLDAGDTSRPAADGPPDTGGPGGKAGGYRLAGGLLGPGTFMRSERYRALVIVGPAATPIASRSPRFQMKGGVLAVTRRPQEP